jgi:hypothetical protein
MWVLAARSGRVAGAHGENSFRAGVLGQAQNFCPNGVASPRRQRLRRWEEGVTSAWTARPGRRNGKVYADGLRRLRQEGRGVRRATLVRGPSADRPRTRRRWVQIALLRVLQELPSKQHWPPSRPLFKHFRDRRHALASGEEDPARKHRSVLSPLVGEERPRVLMAYRSELTAETRHPCALAPA